MELKGETEKPTKRLEMLATMIDRILEISQDFCPLFNQSNTNLGNAITDSRCMYADVIKVTN